MKLIMTNNFEFHNKYLMSWNIQLLGEPYCTREVREQKGANF